jgi:hypothetical protein
MKNLPIIGPLLVLLAVTSGALTQSGDWQVLQGIPSGTKIKILLRHERTFGHCQLEAVANDWLGCYFKALGSRRYPRNEIREVRLGRHSARTGLAIGAGAGAILGATHGSGGGSSRVLGVIILVPVLGGLGAGVGAIADPFIDGKTVYRSLDIEAQQSAVKPQPSTSPIETDGRETAVPR